MAVTFNASTSSGLVTTADNSGQIAFQTNGVTYNPTLIAGTAQASTSGTSIDFTGIPAWVKRITVLFNGVSLSGTANFLLQFGTSSGIENTGYVSTSITTDSSGNTAGVTSTAGLVWLHTNATFIQSGMYIVANVSGNIWTSMHQGLLSSTNIVGGGGNKTLSGTLDRVRITTTNGTDTFDAGSINIMYE